MKSTVTEILAARLDVQAIVLAEIARSLSPAQSNQARDAIGRRIADMVEAKVSPERDEAITEQLVPLLAALRQAG